MSRKSSTNRSGTSNPFANADSSPSRTIASGTTRLIAWPSTGTKPRRAVNGSSASPLFEGESRITIDSTSAGRCSASAVATLPPIEWPTTSARRTPRRSSAAATSRAWLSIP